MFRVITLYDRTVFVAGGLLLFSAIFAEAQQRYYQLNLVTDDQSANPAVIQDPHLVNAWGVSFSATSPFWVSDNGTGLSTLYRVNSATDVPITQSTVVTIPGAGNPTGQAFNSLAGSTTLTTFNKDPFLFVSEDGTISGWRGALGTSAETLALGSADNVYKRVLRVSL